MDLCKKKSCSGLSLKLCEANLLVELVIFRNFIQRESIYNRIERIESWSNLRSKTLESPSRNGGIPEIQPFFVDSRVAQWKRAGPITQRSVDRNYALLKIFSYLFILWWRLFWFRKVHQHVPLAQRIARWTSNPKVLGSIPRWDECILHYVIWANSWENISAL